MGFIFPNQVSGWQPITDTLTLQDITVSSSSIARTTRTIDGAVHASCEDYEAVLSNTNTLPILHEGNDTQFSREYFFTAPCNFRLTKVNIHIGFGLNVSAYTSGDPNLDSVDIKLHRFSDVRREIASARYSSGLSALSATGSQIFLVDDSFFITENFDTGDYLSVEIVTNATAGMTTRQEGVMPMYPTQLASTAKLLSQSAFEVQGVYTGI